MVALTNVLMRGDAKNNGTISLAYFLAVIRDLGIRATLEEVKMYCRRRELFAEVDKDFCTIAGEEDVHYGKFLRQLNCNQKHDIPKFV